MLKFKSLFAFTIFLLLSFAARAQFRWIKAIDEFEILAGASLVSLHGSSSLEEGKQKKVGYSMGIGTRWNIKEKLSLITKLTLDRKGINNFIESQYFDHTTQQLEKGETTYQTNFDYLSLPVTIRYFINKKKSLYTEIGFYAAYLLKCQSIIDYSWQTANDYSDMTDRYYDFDGGLSVALGYKLHIKDKTSVGLWIATNYGLFDVGRQQMNPIADIVKHEALSIGVSVGRMKSVKN